MKQYSYKATSKLVIENEKRRPREQSSGITPLQSENMPGRMGDKVTTSRRPTSVAKRIEKRKDQGSQAEPAEFIDQSVLDVAKDLDLGGNEHTYVPTTRVSQRAFEALLAFVMSKLGDQPRELLRSATDEVLLTMKDEKLQETEKKKLTEVLFGVSMDSDEFTRLSLFCSQINDYKMDDDPAVQSEINPQGILPVLQNIDDDEDEIADEVVEVETEGIAEERHQGVRSKDFKAVKAANEQLSAGGTNTVDLKDIDAFWLERQLSVFYEDTEICRHLSNKILDVLQHDDNDRMIENELASILDFDKLDFISMLLDNRKSISFCVRLARAKDAEEKRRIREDMQNDEFGAKLLESLSVDDETQTLQDERCKRSDGDKTKKRERTKSVAFVDETRNNVHGESLKPNFTLRKLDIDSLKFQRGGRLMTVRDCKLPEGSEHVTNKDFEEWHIPAVSAVPHKSVRLIPITRMPGWAQPAFSNTQQLNRMQSQVYPCAFESDENMLLCAPTGAGKTNVAVLTILRCLANTIPAGDTSIANANVESFKVVYVAPMKALVAEVVHNLSKRLDSLGLEVRELTGDVGMSKKDIEKTQVIVTTPEKWDIITRKSNEKTFLTLIQLLIVDEIHLLHDERGPVLETLVARTLRNVEAGTAATRVVGLSATLPNYKDVATFLRVDKTKGLFYFDSTHRPCPLQQCYVGITAKKAFKRFQLMNELTYNKVKLQVQTSNQVIVFVHSRKETGATCRFLIEKAIEDQIVDQFLNPTSASYEIIQSELANVREEEKLELARLAERVPIPIKESLDEPTAKVSVLLQSFISRLGLDGLALKADMVYVTQSAARLTRALVEVALHENWAGLFDRALSLYKSVTAQQWPSQTPLRQFGHAVGDEVLHRIERKDIPFEKYYDLTVSEVGELLRDSKLGTTVHRLVHSLPRLEVEANVRPLSRSILEVELAIIPDFRFDRKLHKSGEGFWIVVEDADSEKLLHSELFFLRPAVAAEEHTLSFIMKLTTPTPPQYFLRCVSDRWIAPATVVPLSFQALHLPEKFGAYTELTSVKPLSVSKAFREDESMADKGDEEKLVYREAMSESKRYFETESTHFTKLQSQAFEVLFDSDVNAVVASLPGEERDICGELCVARLFTQNPTATAVWVVGRGRTAVHRRYKSFVEGLGRHLELAVRKFLYEGSKEISFLRSASGAVIITTPERWDMFSRRWRQKRESKIMKKIGLLVLDGVHHLSDKGSVGSVMEIIGSRSRYQAAEAMEQGTDTMRIVALSDPVANARDIGHWIGAPPSAVFSFHPKTLLENFSLDVIGSAFSRGPRSTRAASLAKPVFTSIQKHVGAKLEKAIVFVSSRKMARSLAQHLLELATLGGDSNRFGNVNSIPNPVLEQIPTLSLRRTLSHGIAYLHEGLEETEQTLVLQLFAEQKCTVLVANSVLCWTVGKLSARLVILAGTSCDDSGAYVTSRAEYSSSDLLKMLCCVRDVENHTSRRKAVIITEPPLRKQYELYALEPFPAESQLPRFLADHFNAEIEAGVIDTKQEAVDYLTWTFFYRRLPKNPNYYGMSGVSHVEISNHLSEIVETTLSDLESSKCISLETEDEVGDVERSQQRLSTQDIGRVAAHFYIRHATVELFASSVTANTKVRGLLDILSLAAEFSEIPVRLGDEEVLGKLVDKAPIALEDARETSFSSPHVKAHLLLQAQLIRERLTNEIAEDQKRIVLTGVRLLRAMVDVVAIEGWLQPVLAAIELGQMLVQGLWDQAFPLMQLPHIDRTIALSLSEEHNVSDIFGFLDMDDENRSKVLKSLTSNQVLEMSEACQVLPNLNDFVIESVVSSTEDDGTTVTRMVVVLSRNEEDEETNDNNARNTVPTNQTRILQQMAQDEQLSDFCSSDCADD
ncbi:unnamed protein product [Agarophyton chilense]